MFETIRDMLESKKALAMLAAAITAIIAQVCAKYGLDPALADKITGIVLVSGLGYSGSQAVADHGKEAAQITADAAVDVAKVGAGLPTGAQAAATIAADAAKPPA